MRDHQELKASALIDDSSFRKPTISLPADGRVLHSEVMLKSNDDKSGFGNLPPLSHYKFPHAFSEARLRLIGADVPVGAAFGLSAAEYREVVDLLANQLEAMIMLDPTDEPRRFLDSAIESLTSVNGHQEMPADRQRLLELVVVAADKCLLRCSSLSGSDVEDIRSDVAVALGFVAMLTEAGSPLEDLAVSRWQSLMHATAHQNIEEARHLASDSLCEIEDAHRKHREAPGLFKPIRHDGTLIALATRWRDGHPIEPASDAQAVIPSPRREAAENDLPVRPQLSNVVAFPTRNRGLGKAPR